MLTDAENITRSTVKIPRQFIAPNPANIYASVIRFSDCLALTKLRSAADGSAHYYVINMTPRPASYDMHTFNDRVLLQSLINNRTRSQEALAQVTDRNRLFINRGASGENIARNLHILYGINNLGKLVGPQYQWPQIGILRNHTPIFHNTLSWGRRLLSRTLSFCNRHVDDEISAILLMTSLYYAIRIVGTMVRIRRLNADIAHLERRIVRIHRLHMEYQQMSQQT